MLKEKNNDFGKFFLIEFTREILRATKAYEKVSLKQEVKYVVNKKEKAEKKDEPKEIPKTEKTNFAKTPYETHERYIKSIIRKKIRQDDEIISKLKKDQPFEKFLKSESGSVQKNPALPAPVNRIPPLLHIHEPSLPETVSYMKPFPTNQEIDIGKLNVLVNDPLVKTIECNGPEQKIVVMGIMGRKNTPIILNKDEVKDVIHSFSEATRIPVHEGIFKAVAGNLIILAMFSEVIGSKFIIRKMTNRFYP